MIARVYLFSNVLSSGTARENRGVDIFRKAIKFITQYYQVRRVEELFFNLLKNINAVRFKTIISSVGFQENRKRIKTVKLSSWVYQNIK